MSLQTAVQVRSRPRVRVVPRAVESDASDASFLSSAYGLTPDPWQEDVLEDWLGRQRSGRWASATCGLAVPRQNGKNGIIEVRELYGMVQLGERFLHTAHEVKTARKAFLRIISFFENDREYPELAALVREIRKTNGQEAVALTNGGSVEFIARSKGSGRGFTVDVLVCDEAQDLTDEEMAALLPTISAAPLGNPQVILTGTPPDPEKPQQGEVFARVRDDGENKRDPRLAWVDYGVPDGPLPDVDDRSIWREVNPALGGRLNAAEVVRERRLMSAQKFGRERLGWWGDFEADDENEEPIFGEGRWEALETTTEAPHWEALAVSVALDQSAASIAGAARLPDGRLFVGSVEQRPGTAWTVDELKRLHSEFQCAVAIDANGPGADLVDDLQDAGVLLAPAKLADFLDGCAAFYRAVQEATASHLADDEALNTAVDDAEWRSVGKRLAYRSKTPGGDVAMLEAATLAAWAANREDDGFTVW